MKSEFIAHVRQTPSSEWKEHLLAEHLQEVARRSGEAADHFGAKDWAFLAGLWHDLGKYNPAWQEYIGRKSGYHADAHLEGTSGNKVEHSTAGAIHAVARHKGIGRILAYVIAGHHTGLPDWFKGQGEGKGLEERLKGFQHLGVTRILWTT